MAATTPAPADRATTAPGAAPPGAARTSRPRRFLGEAMRYPLIPMTVALLVLVIPAIFADWIAPHDPLDGDLRVRLLPPAWVEGESEIKQVVAQPDPSRIGAEVMAANAARMVRNGGATLLDGATEATPGTRIAVVAKPGGRWDYPLGTDKVGRDILSRIIHGSRISVIVAVMSILCGGLVGSALGIAAGYFGGWPDILLMRAVDISLSIPIILLALVLVTALGASFGTIITVLALLLWAHYARMSRGETLSVRVQDFVARSRVAGSSHPRIMARHIFPNVFNSLVVLATLQVGFVIILESTLSFLGAGIPRPTPAWGLMVADGRELVTSESGWWVSLFPGLTIMLTVLSMNLLGDWLRDRLDPKQRQV